jgi:radical SAM protein with 4Fe4S-binding SPASM domain
VEDALELDTDQPALPTELQVEVTGSCNLSCRMCLVAYRPRLGRSAHLTTATLRALLDDLPSVRRLTLQGLGEPLLVPHLEEMVAEAASRGILVGLNSNATLLSEPRARALIGAGLDWLHVSVDAADAATFEYIRVGARLDEVTANLRRLVQVRAELGADRPRIQMNTVLMRRNAAELDDLVRLAAGVGVDRLWVQRLSHDFSDVAGEETFVEIRRWTASQLLDDEATPLLEQARALAAELGLDLRLPGGGPDPARGPDDVACDWPWRSAYVGHDGTVQPCCMVMGQDRAKLGNVRDTPLSALWHGPEYRQLRQGLRSDAPPAICAGCSLYRRRF